MAEGQTAQRCAAVAQSARPSFLSVAKKTQGRADLRAAQHSGGRLGFAKAAAGPKINRSNYFLLNISYCLEKQNGVKRIRSTILWIII